MRNRCAVFAPDGTYQQSDQIAGGQIAGAFSAFRPEQK
jgi:hypothetical protein